VHRLFLKATTKKGRQLCEQISAPQTKSWLRLWWMPKLSTMKFDVKQLETLLYCTVWNEFQYLKCLEVDKSATERRTDGQTEWPLAIVCSNVDVCYNWWPIFMATDLVSENLTSSEVGGFRHVQHVLPNRGPHKKTARRANFSLGVMLTTLSVCVS